MKNIGQCMAGRIKNDRLIFITSRCDEKVTKKKCRYGYRKFHILRCYMHIMNKVKNQITVRIC